MLRPSTPGLLGRLLVSFLTLSLASTVAPARAQQVVAEDPGAAEATAQPTPAAPSAPTSETDRRIEILAAELERLRLGEVAPRAEQSRFGLGPAASKVYAQEQGVSLGGYGELLYANPGDGPAVFDFYRSILYAGYKFDDRWVLNTEIEIEHVKEVFLEFAYLDYLWRPELGFRAGLILVPMGILNEIHEPTTFLGALRPATESRVLPTTWRENGAGIFGAVGPVSYRFFGVTGLDATGFSGSGVRGGRQKGAKALSDDFAGVLRVDVTPIPGLLVGGSAYYGEADQSQVDGPVSTFIYEVHGDFEWRGLQLRGLFARAELGGVARLNDHLGLTGAASVGEALQGAYVQAGYDVLVPFGRKGLVPYVRYEALDTQLAVPDGFAADAANDDRILTAGVAFYPIEQIVLKTEYQDLRDESGGAEHQWNVALGYIF